MSVAGISAPSASLPIQVEQLMLKKNVGIIKKRNLHLLSLFAAPRPAYKDSNANGIFLVLFVAIH